MKKFFKKIWEAIVAFFDKVADFLVRIPSVCLLYCILGLALTSLFAIVFPIIAEWPAVPVFFLGIIVITINALRGRGNDLECFVYYLGGSLLIQLFSWIA